MQAELELNLLFLVHEKVKPFKVVKISLLKTLKNVHIQKKIYLMSLLPASVPIGTLFRTKSIPFIE